MPAGLFLSLALGALAAGIALAAFELLPKPAPRHSVAGALVVIERGYGQRREAAPAAAGDEGGAARLPVRLGHLIFRLTPASTAPRLQHKLDLAGNPPRWTIDRIYAAKGLCALAFGMLGALYGIRHPALALAPAAGFAMAGYFLPNVLLYNASLKRQDKIRAKLPDALDMLTVCVEAGLGFDAALSQVARNTTGPLAAEFARALREMQIGMGRAPALRAMTGRTTVPELRMFVSALIQAAELGIPVAQVLREQAREMRLRRRQRAEEVAQKVPVKILLPLITCLFPVLFVIVIGPGAIMIAHSLLGI